MAINYPIVFKLDDKGLKQAESGLKKFGKAAAATAAAAAAAVGTVAAVSVREFAKFDAALTQSTAIMGDLSDAMREDMAATAREVAKSTTFSAEQAAESFYFLASAGLDATASIKAMPTVAQFAQAGMFDMALATDLLTDAQSALGLSIRDDAVANMENMVRVSDTLARASQLANATIEQFSTSLTTKAGTALKTVGKDVEEGAAALAVFADAGVKGELAGTQLTNTIFGLSDRAKAVPDQFEALGLSVFDASGNMRNFADIADNFTEVLGPMTTQQKLATLANLGFTKQARAGLLLLLENGDALRNYESELRNAGGTTQEVADKQLESLSAQFDLLKSRVKDVGIEIGAALAPALLDLIDVLTPILDDFIPRLGNFMAELAPKITMAVQGIVTGVQVLVDFFQNNFNPAVRQAFDLFEKYLPVIATFVGVFGAFTLAINGTTLAIKALYAAEKIQIAVQTVLNAIMAANPMYLVAVAVAALAAGIVYLATQTTFFQDTWEAVTTAVREFYETYLKSTIDDLIAGITQFYNDYWKPIIDGMLAVWGAVVEGISSYWTEVLWPIFKAIIDIIVQMVKNIAEPLFHLMSAAFKILAKGFELYWNNIIKPAFEAWIEIIKFIWEKIVQPISGFIGDAFKAMAELVGTIFTNMADGIRDTFTSLIDIVKAPLNVIFGFLNRLIDGINSIRFTIPGIPFFGIPPYQFEGLNLPRLPQLAEGGIVMPQPGGVLANLAEAGKPEAVIPLDRAGGIGGNTINITVNAGMGADGQRIGEQIVEEIIRYEKLSGKVFARV
jgi:TP901 family phage tail tape measure protein